MQEYRHIEDYHDENSSLKHPKGYIIDTDGDGHWYAVPEELHNQFDMIFSPDDYGLTDEEAEEKFIKLFEDYQFEGGFTEFTIIHDKG